jgi:hypothetical protein
MMTVTVPKNFVSSRLTCSILLQPSQSYSKCAKMDSRCSCICHGIVDGKNIVVPLLNFPTNPNPNYRGTRCQICIKSLIKRDKEAESSLLYADAKRADGEADTDVTDCENGLIASLRLAMSLGRPNKTSCKKRCILYDNFLS